MQAISQAHILAFASLMARTDEFLNADAKMRPEYYQGRGGRLLEDDVCHALEYCAQGTPFAGQIVKISGQKFPDIVVANYFGVEVKSTKDNNWTSVGSSILESSRVSGVELIYLTFGKLGGTVSFISRPYEQCLSGIAVTHMPRYLINMQLPIGNTIFDEMGLSYEQLRHLDNPIAPVSNFYRSRLAPGESLWWAGSNADETVLDKIRLWRNVPLELKKLFKSYALVNFPQIVGGNYDEYGLFLASQGVVDSHLRDQFSSGGQMAITLSDGSLIKLPAVFRRIFELIDTIVLTLAQEDPKLFNASLSLGSALNTELISARINQWLASIIHFSSIPTLDPNIIYDLISRAIASSPNYVALTSQNHPSSY